MKILLQINSFINFGSTGHIVEDIGNLAIANGWESYIVYARNDRNSLSKKIKIGDNWECYWHVLVTRLFDRHGLASRKATKKLIKQIHLIKPDIIHLHNIHGYYVNFDLLFKYLSTINTSIVWTLHDCWAYTGHCVHYSFIKCEKWKNHCCHCPIPLSYPKSLLIDRSKQNFENKKNAFCSVKNMIIVPVSQWLAYEVSQSFLNKYPIKQIYNGIDTRVFSPILPSVKKKYRVEDKFMILGVASIWNERKGLKNFKELACKLSNDKIIFLVGLTKKQMINLPSNIIGIERTENIHQLVELYSSADIFINPTWDDNFPTTNIESLSCGTPVITYNTGGSIEAINNDTGFIVAQGDITGLLNAINLVKQKSKSFYSSACRKRAMSCFDRKDRYEEYLQLYEEMKK
ncbi:N-acetyl-alpha-D-glucosaminyl L-malate synthase [termite gut metagenome]|uniref:N-acetyl-alpha-D-glucosaminyl L-malate synthase n=1 Tax=termite gut metagenome TaxID=433724 RepID=A0A5J4S237_9ZZZZ